MTREKLGKKPTKDQRTAVSGTRAIRTTSLLWVVSVLAIALLVFAGHSGAFADGCTYTLSRTVVYSPGSYSGSEHIFVEAGEGCPWAASSNDDWILIVRYLDENGYPIPSGQGSGTVVFDVMSNESDLPRTGSIEVAGATVTVEQERAPLTVDPWVERTCSRNGDDLLVTVVLMPTARFAANEYYYTYAFSDGTTYARLHEEFYVEHTYTWLNYPLYVYVDVFAPSEQEPWYQTVEDIVCAYSCVGHLCLSGEFSGYCCNDACVISQCECEYYPEVTFARFDPFAQTTRADILSFFVTFDQPVHNVDLSDFVATGTTGQPTGISTLVAGEEYTVTVSGGDLATYEGYVGVDLADGHDIEADDSYGLALMDCAIGLCEMYVLDNTGLM